MLYLLQIENIATIEKASVEFSSGLNILTGETGAGKSILIDSIHAVLGAKTSRELIRTGAANASVCAVFYNVGTRVEEKLIGMGIPLGDDHSLQIRRTLYKDGKNACYVNGTAVTVSMLRTVTSDLIHIHGQRDTQGLLQTERHLDYLDDFADTGALSGIYTDCFSECRRIKKELNALRMDESEKARQIDLLQYQIGEIENANPLAGEMEALRHKRNVIQNAAKVRAGIEDAIRSLTGNDVVSGADSYLRSAVQSLLNVSEVVSGLGDIAGQLEAAKDTVEEAASVLDDALGQLGASDDELEKTEERLDLLSRLSKKYGGTEEAMLAFLEDARNLLRQISFSEERSAQLQMLLEQKEQELKSAAAALSEKRRAASAVLAEKILDELRFLDMPNVEFCVEIKPCEYTERGADSVCFLLSANPGETPKPLDRVASGGELSRVMLAMKNVLHYGNLDSSMIFDEIDSGVSGKAAGKIAQKLSALAADSQVLCVTHSAQIAAYADVHKLIKKSVQNGKTYTSIETLSPDQRAYVLAEITYGGSPSDLQVQSSAQMILQAQASVHAIRAKKEKGGSEKNSEK